MKQITSFSIDWHNCSLSCGAEQVRERTSIYLRTKLIRIEKLNGADECTSKEEYHLSYDGIRNLFNFMNEMDKENVWKNNYSVEVCDGSRWEMRLRYSDKTVKLIKRTVEKPDKGRKIETMIKEMLSQERCMEAPILFGCSCEG